MNLSVRYLEGVDSREEKYSLRVLAKIIENINCYTKEFILSNMQELWKMNSPNITMAQ